MATVETNLPTSHIEAEVHRIRALMEKGEFPTALAAAEKHLREVPENRDLLYMKAVSQRYSGDVPAALQTLDNFATVHPGYGRLFQERGHCLRAVGDKNAAIAAYERAVALNAALPASWTALNELYREAGRHAAAKSATDYSVRLAALPPAVLTASSMLNEGDIFLAEALVRKFLQTHGNHIEAMRLLAQIGVKLDVLDDAEFLLESIMEFAPANHVARYEYGLVLSQRHKHQQALEQSRILLKLEPGNRAYKTLYAAACVGLGEHSEALRVYRELLAGAPRAADIQLSIAHALKTLGDQPAAIEAYKKAAEISPAYGDSYWSLANLKTYRFEMQEIERMRSLVKAPETLLVDRYHLCFALGKALEDRSEYADSLQFYEQGNALKHAEVKHDPVMLERSMRAQARVCTAEFFRQRSGNGCDRPDPIFIVGLPRSGSTLLEQILASHSMVEGTMELPDIPRLAHELNGREHENAPRYPAVLGNLDASQLKAFGESYLTQTQVYRRQAPFFVDKMPNNFRHIGLIHLILPNAKIIDARRDAMACCFSNYKQLFAAGQEFTYSFEDIARY